METDSLPFKVSARVATLLGEQSVSNVIVALTELVKNAYDADASEVHLTFQDANENLNIVVEDNGHGMTFDDLRDKWMVVGTDDKRFNRFSPNQRRKVGEKGIGRFAVQKLGDKLTLISRPKNSDEKITLHIDWAKYSEQGVTFDQIRNPVSVSKRENEPSGMTLIISDLKDEWTKPRILNLQSQLSDIVPPSWDQEEFSIVLNAPHVNMPDVKIDPGIFNHAAYKMECELFEDGKGKYSIFLGNKHHVSSTADFGRLVCGPMKFTVYYFPLGPSGSDKKLQPYVLKSNELRKQLQSHHGIKIFRDGFRVKPYGDPGDDWLGLNLIRLNNPTGAFSNNTLMGVVEISDDKNPIRDTTTREGLIKNDAFYDMRTFLLKCLMILSAQRTHDFKEEIPELYESPSMKKITNAAKRLSKSAKTEKDRAVINTALKDIQESALEIQSQLINKTNMSFGLASLGISVAAISHEIGDSIGSILQRSQAVLQTIHGRPISHPENKKLWEETLKDILKIREFISFAAVFTSAEERQKSAVEMREIIQIVLNAYESVFENQAIKVTLDIPEELPIIEGYKVDFESVMINLVTNAIEAMRDVRGDRKIKITCNKVGRYVAIRFSDSGFGIPKENREFVFEPLWTSKAEGTGLGLSIIHEIIEGYEGTIEITDSEFGNGASFLIKLPIGDVF